MTMVKIESFSKFRGSEVDIQTLLVNSAIVKMVAVNKHVFTFPEVVLDIMVRHKDTVSVLTSKERHLYMLHPADTEISYEPTTLLFSSSDVDTVDDNGNLTDIPCIACSVQSFKFVTLDALGGVYIPIQFLPSNIAEMMFNREWKKAFSNNTTIASARG
jgi:hypothetical protein